MRRALIVAVAVPFVSVLAGCSDGPTTAAVDELTPAFHLSGRSIAMLDACDPETFPPGLCNPVNRRGGIPFSTFVAQLQQHQEVNAWRFSPNKIIVQQTVSMDVINLGGIHHSFTEVAEFGGGFVGFLNALSGNLVPAPECVHPTIPGAPNPNVVLVAPGDHDHVTFEPGVQKKYMCCIHPWMRAVSM